MISPSVEDVHAAVAATPAEGDVHAIMATPVEEHFHVGIATPMEDGNLAIMTGVAGDREKEEANVVVVPHFHPSEITSSPTTSTFTAESRYYLPSKFPTSPLSSVSAPRKTDSFLLSAFGNKCYIFPIAAPFFSFGVAMPLFSLATYAVSCGIDISPSGSKQREDNGQSPPPTVSVTIENDTKPVINIESATGFTFEPTPEPNTETETKFDPVPPQYPDPATPAGAAPAQRSPTLSESEAVLATLSVRRSLPLKNREEEESFLL
ncbi:hypothetical protein QBC47DRAFT_428940 [Echria macrotheca]|uniref:Uncharacterized protein n=1 Tax=Echria macrotheca TaxID=438768 RepID=A0AAJ0BQ90_9PEZI|nr:hypothetical protein QBC47DRAFT_428940 [Echria macrotheca]